MADIFVSYTNQDRDWAFWIGQELEALGHIPHIHEWEIPAGGDIAAWMEERHDKADHILCVVSDAYLGAPYSNWERRAAQWAAASNRPNFALPVFVEKCTPPTLLATAKRCDLHGLSEEEARVRLADYLKPKTPPTAPVPFPGAKKAGRSAVPTARMAVDFPGSSSSGPASVISNIPIAVPRHFLGRTEALDAIAASLKGSDGRVAITALHGLRGVGKTTLAAAYAHDHRNDYRVTWWVRAQSEPTMRADLVGLGVRLGWIAADEKEEPALAVVMGRLRDEGDGLLLIYDNAIDTNSIKPFLPLSGNAQVLITSNFHAWHGIAAPVAIEVWRKEIGADFLIARAGRADDRAAAEELSDKLGGLPLAHEQAGAYCERLGVSFAEYAKRFEAAPLKYLADEKSAPGDYHPEHYQEHHDRLTVAKAFALAIDEAAKLHPAAEPLIVHAALLAPEPIPLYLFSEAREQFGEPLATAFADDGLDETVAALRAFALVDRETIPDERDPSITTDSIRLHRLVREVAAARCASQAQDSARRTLIAAMAAVYPDDVPGNPSSWPRARRLDALALALVGDEAQLPKGAAATAVDLLNKVAGWRRTLAAYEEARSLLEHALAIQETAFGAEHPDAAPILNNLGELLREQDKLADAKPFYERSLAIVEKAFGKEHPATAFILNNLGLLSTRQDDFSSARCFLRRSLVIRKKIFGPEHPHTATALNNFADLLQGEGKLVSARKFFERALKIREKVLGPEHPDTAVSLNNLADLMIRQGDLAAARPRFERSLEIHEKVLGPVHPNTNTARGNLARVLLAYHNPNDALPLAEAALAAHDKVLGPNHPWTKRSASITAAALDALKRGREATALRAKYGLNAPPPAR